MSHYAVMTSAGATLVRVTGAGRSMALPDLILTDRAPDAQTMDMTGISVASRIGPVGIAFPPFAWSLGVLGSAGGVLLTAASQQLVGIPGAVVRGVDLGLQSMALTGIASAATIGGALLRRVDDTRLVILAGGEWPALVSGNAGYQTMVPGGLIRIPGVISQTMSLTGILAPARIADVTLVLGRATWRFDTPGLVPVNPLGVL